MGEGGLLGNSRAGTYAEGVGCWKYGVEVFQGRQDVSRVADNGRMDGN